MVAVAESTIGSKSADALASRLDDPRVTAALLDLLDHSDLLAVLLAGLDGFVRRGETITHSLAEGVTDLRSITGASKIPDIGALVGLVRQAAAMAGPLAEALPVLSHLLESDLADARVVDVGSMVSRAAIKGAARAQAESARVRGVRAILHELKDDDVSRGLGFVFAIVRALGQELDRTPLATR